MGMLRVVSGEGSLVSRNIPYFLPVLMASLTRGSSLEIFK
jgi:hypothetical protein